MEKYEAVVLVKHRAFVQLKTALQKMMPADIAQLLSEMIEEQDGFGEKELTLIFRVLPKELAAETFTYMSSDLQMLLINALISSRKCLPTLFHVSLKLPTLPSASR